jgi:hypothetical protein
VQHGTRATRQTHKTWELSRDQSTDARDRRTHNDRTKSVGGPPTYRPPAISFEAPRARCSHNSIAGPESTTGRRTSQTQIMLFTNWNHSVRVAYAVAMCRDGTRSQMKRFRMRTRSTSSPSDFASKLATSRHHSIRAIPTPHDGNFTLAACNSSGPARQGLRTHARASTLTNGLAHDTHVRSGTHRCAQNILQAVDGGANMKVIETDQDRPRQRGHSQHFYVVTSEVTGCDDRPNHLRRDTAHLGLLIAGVVLYLLVLR